MVVTAVTSRVLATLGDVPRPKKDSDEGAASADVTSPHEPKDPKDLPPISRVLEKSMAARDLGSRVLAQRLTDRGVPTSPSLLREYLSGQRLADPRRSTVAALAVELGIPVAVFFSWAAYERWDEELDSSGDAGDAERR